MRPRGDPAFPSTPVAWNLAGLPGPMDAYGKRIRGTALLSLLRVFHSRPQPPGKRIQASADLKATRRFPQPLGRSGSPVGRLTRVFHSFHTATTTIVFNLFRPGGPGRFLVADQPLRWPLLSAGNSSRRFAPTLATFSFTLVMVRAFAMIFGQQVDVLAGDMDAQVEDPGKMRGTGCAAIEAHESLGPTIGADVAIPTEGRMS